MGYGMGDLPGLKVTLERENIVAEDYDVAVLSGGNAPNQKMNLARVLRKICRNFLANEGIRQIRQLEAALNRVVIGDGDVIHPALDQFPMQLLGIGIAIGKIKTPEEPFLGAIAVTRVNV